MPGNGCAPHAVDKPLIFLRADVEDPPRDLPFVIITRSREEVRRWLHDGSPALQWIQVEGLLGDSDVWAIAAQGAGGVPLDVVLSAPGVEFSHLYRLVDVRSVRDVRVSMPAAPGFLKALRLAASLGLPVRLLPGQPPAEAIEEFEAALAFYLHDPMVEAPIEFFHTALAWMRGAHSDSLWTICEDDPAIFRHCEAGSQSEPARWHGSYPAEGSRQNFVPEHLARLIEDEAECAACPWQQLCQGYFKWPEPAYSCNGVKQIFSALQAAADEIDQDLAAYGEGATSTKEPAS